MEEDRRNEQHSNKGTGTVSDEAERSTNHNQEMKKPREMRGFLWELGSRTAI